MDRQTTSGLPLPTHLENLESRLQAALRFQAGPAYLTEELGIFSDYAREKKLFLEDLPDSLNRPPDDEGNEHQVYLPEIDRFLKATWPGFFGVQVIYSSDQDRRSSPIAYLKRWHLHNQLFGDDIRFLGAHQTPDGIRLIIDQPAIAGEPASEPEIKSFFQESGWEPFQIDGNLAFLDHQSKIAISDTHRGNIVKMSDGLLAPIDLRVQPLTAYQLDAITSHL